MLTLDDYKDMLDSVPCGAGLFDEEDFWNACYLNEAYYKLMGYTKQEYQALSGESISNLLHPLDYERVLQEVQDIQLLIQQGLTYRIISKDGTLRWIKLGVSRKTVGTKPFLFCTFSDITSQRLDEERTANEQSRYRLILEQANASIFEWNYTTKTYYCSESYKDYSISLEPITDVIQNKASLEVVHPDDKPVLMRFIAGLSDPNTKNDVILRMKMIDDSFRWSRLHSIITRDSAGKPLRAIGAIFDINDEMERSVMMNELVHALPGGVAIFKVGEKPECLYYNEALKNLSDYPDADFSAVFLNNDYLDNFILPEDREHVLHNVLEPARRGEAINCTFRYYKNIHADKPDIGWVHLSGVKIREEDGLPVYYVIFVPPSEESKAYKYMSDNSMTPNLVLDQRSNTILYANRAFRRLYKLSEEYTFNQITLKELIPSVDATVFNHLKSGLSHTREASEILNSETKRIYHLCGRVIDWNGRAACLFDMNDQTDVQKKNDYLDNMINKVPGGVAIYDISQSPLKLRHINKGFLALLQEQNVSFHNLVSKDGIQNLHAEDKNYVVASIKKTIREHVPLDISYRVRTRTGSYVWLRMIGKPETAADGQKLLYCSFVDVNTQMEAKTQLESDKIILDRAMKAANMCSWEYIVDTKQINQSLFGKIQNGYPDFIDNVPESILADGYVHPDSIETYKKIFEEHTNSNTVVQEDICIRNADRSGWEWQRVTLTPVYDQNGKHVRSVGTAMNVTEQKEIEQQYRHYLEDLGSIGTDGLIAKGLFNLTTNTKEYYEKQWDNAIRMDDNASFDDWLNIVLSMIVRPEHKLKFEKMFSREQLLRAFTVGKTENVYVYQRRTTDGNIFWAKTTCKLFIEPTTRAVMYFLYTYDITDQRIMQEMIDQVVQLDYDFLTLLDCKTLNTRVYYRDQEDGLAQSILYKSGYETDVLSSEFSDIPEDEIEQYKKDMSVDQIRAQLANKNVYTVYHSLRNAEGKLTHKKVQISYLDRTSEKVLISRSDITDIYDNEQKRMHELSEAMLAVEKANNTKTEFLSRMSHDLRTPMNAILGLTELALDDMDNTKKLASYLKDIRISGTYLQGLVTDCLDFEKLSEGKMWLRPVAYDYADFKNNISTILMPLSAEKNVTLSFGPNITPYRILTDPVRFEQIFINLLSNAIRFSNPGGQVELLLENNTVHGQTLSIDFIVRDYGIGMSKAFMKHMYEPFTQEHADVSAQLQGSGLGLSIVKKIVELMDGTITVKSTQGEGTEFTVHLNMTIADEVDAAQETQPIIAGSLRGRKILLVEDHPLNTVIAKQLLEKRGMIVVCENNGQKGVECFKKSGLHEFDAILMDIRMPVMTGLEAAKAIRALDREDAAHVPILAMTANAFDEDIQKSFEAGMNMHLSKPIESERLYQAIWMSLTENERYQKTE